MDVASAGRSASSKPITVVIPAFREAAAVGAVVESVRSSCGDLVEETIVVDDGSDDGTAEAAERAGARVLRHMRNRGYGAALKSGIRAARTEFVATIDADGQHRPEEIRRLWTEAGRSDMVVGARRRPMRPYWRIPGKWLLRLLACHIARRRIPDLNSGFRIFRRETANRYLHVCPLGFSFSTTLSLALISRGAIVTYVPVEAAPRIGRSTVTLMTGLNTIILILRIATLFEPLRVFLPASLLFVGGGVAWGIPYALAGKGVSVASMLAIVTGVLLFAVGLLCDQISHLRLERFEGER